MGFGSRYIPVRHAARFGRLLVTLAMLPAIVLSPLTAHAILIHDHHGHDTHGHTVTLCNLDDFRENSEHQHENHEHDGLPEEESSAHDSSTVVITLELPDALLRVRGLSAGNVVGTRLALLPLPVAIAPDPAASTPCPNARPWSAAPDLRAGSMVAGILLANHALLL